MPSATARLLLVRHGETQWQAENRYAGVSDVALTGRGLRQAAALATWAARRRPEAVVCSPLGRARRTAEPTARALGLVARVVSGLREFDFGWAEGRTLGELRVERPDLVEAFLADAETGAFPGAEPVADAAKRAVAALHATADAHPGRQVLVVAHSTVLRIALCDLLGIPVGRYRLVFPRLDNAAVTELELGPDRAALRCLNVPLAPSGTLGWAGPEDSAGPTGWAGPEGLAGAEGSAGPTSWAGPEDSAGPTGWAGPEGLAGPTGWAGAEGSAGPGGSAGTLGRTGPEGSPAGGDAR